MINRQLLKQHIENLISKNVLSEEVVNDLEAVIEVIDTEPVEPESCYAMEEYHCPICGSEVHIKDSFCPCCGRGLKWDPFTRAK